MMVMQSNLWGLAVLSAVLRRELKVTYDALDHELKAVGRYPTLAFATTSPAIPGLNSWPPTTKPRRTPAATITICSHCPATAGNHHRGCEWTRHSRRGRDGHHPRDRAHPSRLRHATRRKC